MRTRSLVLFLVVVLAIPVLAQRPVTIDDIMQYKQVGAVEISPDGKRAAVVVSQPDFDENVQRSNIYIVNAEGTAMIKLTNGPRRDTQPRWSPDGKTIAFISDRPAKPEKAAKSQIWIISPDGGEAWQLTRERLNVNSFEWLPDGKRMVLAASAGDTDDDEKKKKDKDDALVVESDLKPARLYVVALPDGKTDLLYSGKHISSISVSPKGDEVAFAEQPTPKVPDSFNSNVRVLTLATKAVRDLVSADFASSDPKFSPDGRWVAFEANSRTDWWGNSYIYVVPAAGGQAKNLSAAFDERPGSFEWADDSSALYFSGPRKMDVGIFKVSLDGKLETVDVRTGMAQSLSIANGMMAYDFESPAQPNDVHFVSLRAPAPTKKGKASAWTFVPKKVTDFNPQVKELALAKYQPMTWRNRNDGMDIEGQLFLPANHTPGKALPTLLIIHGGPAGVFNNAFVMRRGAYPVQVFTSAGYAVLMPNPRGSGGYGLAFRKANVKDWGYADYHDIQNGIDELIDKGIADKDRLGVMGWSYGGFMTSWTVTQTSRFKAASIGAAVTNLFSFYGTTDIPPFIESYFGAKPWENRELMAKHSAMYHLDKVTTPSLLQHGGEDRRVPYAQSEEFFTGLRIRGIPSELIKYPRQPHGIQEPKLIKDAMTRNLEWFDRYVMGNQQAAKWHTTGGTTVATTPGQQ